MRRTTVCCGVHKQYTRTETAHDAVRRTECVADELVEGLLEERDAGADRVRAVRYNHVEVTVGGNVRVGHAPIPTGARMHSERACSALAHELEAVLHVHTQLRVLKRHRSVRKVFLRQVDHVLQDECTILVSYTKLDYI